MFIDNQWKKNQTSENVTEEGSYLEEHKAAIFLFLGFSVLLIVIIGGVFWFISNFSNSSQTGINPGGDQSTTTAGQLPGDENGDDDQINPDDLATTTITRAEQLNFGDFYNAPSYDFTKATSTDAATTTLGVEIPLNVKAQVANFYNINRKINLDQEIDRLNTNGFAIIANPFGDQDNDFYSMYRRLIREDLPIVVTKDFLNYHYQYVLEENFKLIEAKLFYDNLWNINKTLYEKAKERYERLLSSEGLSQDPYVQAARQEIAFFATALKLLEPTEEQISTSQLESDVKFSATEKSRFSIDLPYYLRDDVPKEVGLIRKGEVQGQRSPILFYQRDYSQFQVPKDYKVNSRLNNFYLTMKWLNSLFPLYYENDSCPGCVLDRADWRISVLTSILIANDLAQEQSIKNEWAQIYKVVSYFKGLRDELTYLQYVQQIRNSLGDEYEIEEDFFDNDLEELDEKLVVFRDEMITNFDFNEIEGAFDYTSTSSRSQIGFRVLSQPFVPNEYIQEQLTYPSVTNYFGAGRNDLLKTYCRGGAGRALIRCRSFGWDVANLIQKIPDQVVGFQINSNYQGYETQVDFLRSQLDRFNNHAWHSSNYWNTVYVYQQVLANSNPEIPIVNTPQWTERNLQALLGSLVDTQVEKDKLRIYEASNGFSSQELEQSDLVEGYNYIEADLIFIRELEANIKMIQDMLRELGVSDWVNQVVLSLAEVRSNFQTLEKIMERQLASKELTGEDIDFIKEFVTLYEIEEPRNKELNHEKALRESISGIKLLLLTYNKEGRKIMGLGPVYNYQEHTR